MHGLVPADVPIGHAGLLFVLAWSVPLSPEYPRAANWVSSKRPGTCCVGTVSAAPLFRATGSSKLCWLAAGQSAQRIDARAEEADLALNLGDACSALRCATVEPPFTGGYPDAPGIYPRAFEQPKW
jgi:hypothetical protein